MNSVWVAFALCVGPLADAELSHADVPGEAASGTITVDRSSSLEELRSACRALLRNSAPRQKPDPAEVVPQLVTLYEIAGEAEQLGPAGRRRLQDRLASRLKQIRERLLSDVGRERRGSRQKKIESNVRATSLAAGPATPGAQALIDLIQTTVAPSSWDINGGLGTICYFPRFQALVIRQSQAVHGAIGGALQGLQQP